MTIKSITLIHLETKEDSYGDGGAETEIVKATHRIDLEPQEGELRRVIIIAQQRFGHADVQLYADLTQGGMRFERRTLVKRVHTMDSCEKVTLDDVEVCCIAMALIQDAADGARVLVAASEDAIAQMRSTEWADV